MGDDNAVPAAILSIDLFIFPVYFVLRTRKFFYLSKKFLT